MKARLLLLVAVLFLCSSLLPAQQDHHAFDPNEKLGTVSFPIPCASSVQKPFERGVALLHSFWYEEAEKQFEEVALKDPHCAMAYWGQAMSLYHQLWERPGKSELKRGWELTQKAQAIGSKDARERAYIAAIGSFYRDSGKLDHEQRATAYSNAMEKVYLQYPQDHEAAAFYALSLLASEPDHDTGFVNRKKAISILNVLFEQEPNHPGVAHYLIHSCDKPQLAHRGLAAARRYAGIASSSPHAVHMPSHIFVRLGLWQEDINSNLASIAATDNASAMHMAGAGHRIHAMDFLEYAYLQIGKDSEAKGVIDQLTAMQKSNAYDAFNDYVDDANARFPAMYALETHHWKDAVGLLTPAGAAPENRATTYWAQAIGAGHMRDAATARSAVNQYDAMLQAVAKGSRAYILEGMISNRDEAHAWLAFAQGNNSEALRLLRSVADKQDAAGKREVELPTREMLADMLLEMQRPQEALGEYETSMKTDPNRFNGLYGAARAAEMAHQPHKATIYYAQLLKNCGKDSDRPELARAKTLLASR